MGFLSRFEGRMEDTFEGAADRMGKAPISPVQIAKKAEKVMRREKMVGAGKQYAPTLYTVLVNADDDKRLFGYYPTLAGETETYLAAKAADQGLVMDGQPLVRFIADEDLKHGKFEIIGELVAAPIVAQLRNEELVRYGLRPAQSPLNRAAAAGAGFNAAARGMGAAYDNSGVEAYTLGAPAQVENDPFAAPVGAYPYDPVDEQGFAVDYDNYTMDSHQFNDFQGDGANSLPFGAEPGAYQEMPESDTALFAQGGAAATAVPVNMPAAYLTDIVSNRTLQLGQTYYSIGRESANDIRVADINASRRHAELFFDQSGVWVLRDLGSTNGTSVNSQPIAVQQLASGDRITIGTTSYMFTVA